GLGLIFANYLAKTFRARLALLGRSELTPEQQGNLTLLKNAGAEVLYIRGDVASLEDVAAAVRQAKKQFNRLDGGIHAAGIIRDEFLLRKKTEDFKAVLSPKVLGAIALDEATRDEPLDFFVLFSSIAGVLGN